MQKILTQSLYDLYKDNNCQSVLNRLFTNKRKEVIQLALQLGLGIGADVKKIVTPDDTTNYIIIGMSLDGKSVTRKTPGFSHSITNLEELTSAVKKGTLLKTNDDFEHLIKLVQLALKHYKQEAQKQAQWLKQYLHKPQTSKDFTSLSKFEKWLILNKPQGSLTHLCLRFMRNYYTDSQINEIQNKVDNNLFKKLCL